MRKNFAALLSAILLGGMMAGCQTTPSGSMKAGVPFVNDTIESRYRIPVAQIFAAARQVLEFNGTLTSENTVNNSLEAAVDNRRVIVKVDEVEPGVSRIWVEARKKMGTSDIALAAEIDKQIALRLR